MPRLVSRQRFIPNGFKFYDAVLKWTAPPNASFAVICDGIQTARRANPGLSASKGLSTDLNAIAEELDAYNAAICQQMGWTDFYTGSGGGSAPFPQPHQQPRPLHQRLQNVAVGSETVVEWIASGAEAVPAEQSAKRAEVCVACPLNTKGDWLARFTVPAQNAIRAELNRKREMKLETPLDDQLGVCGGCDCPLPLMVWVPLQTKLKRMTESARAALHPECWILDEMPK